MPEPCPASRPTPVLLGGLQTVASRYDLILCDVWGVLHNSVVASADAADALTRFRTGGGCVVLVSNAPRPGASVIAHLDELGVPRTAFDAIVTSGDITRAAITERLDQVVHHIGPPRDAPLFEGLDVRFGDLGTADYVVCSGLDDDTRETAEDYRDRLARMRARDLWMVCANPDLVVERGPDLVPCAGALAAVYEQMGGRVFYAGKPYEPVYEAAVSLAAKLSGRAELARSRILAIGDAIRTDIAGAARYGIDSLLVLRGIHTVELGLGEGPLRPAEIQAWLRRQPVQPSGIIERLVWDRPQPNILSISS